MQAKYVGSELELFASATKWRSYWAAIVRPHLGEHVLEVGAGIGSVTRILSDPERSWTALEPDQEMARDLRKQMASPNLRVINGVLQDLPKKALFDTVVYIDVLEHIEDDQSEIVKASGLLRPEGKLIILAPAHNFLFSPFDRHVGHFRRYSLSTLDSLRPAGFVKTDAVYLDSLGALLSGANRLLLRQQTPSRNQILFWDRFIVPLSQIVDPLFLNFLGKSALVVWTKSQISDRAGGK